MSLINPGRKPYVLAIMSHTDSMYQSLVENLGFLIADDTVKQLVLEDCGCIPEN